MGITIDPTPFAHVADAITGRRTVKHYDGQPIDRESLEHLLELARWAPNHRLTNPWRFAVLNQAAIKRLAAMLAADPAIALVPDPAKGPAKLAKMLGRLPSLGAIIQVCWVRAANPTSDLEDHAAVAAAVQNLILGASAMGLGSFWTTSAALATNDAALVRFRSCDPRLHGQYLAWPYRQSARGSAASTACRGDDMAVSAETPARPPHLGLHHVALFVKDLVEARHFYVDLLGFRVEWEPDADNLYLTSGSDNLALHRLTGQLNEPQRLDHLGICCPDPATVDRWHTWLAANNVRIVQSPRRHRDGAYSFYCLDYDGMRVQIIHHPPITRALIRAQES